MPQSAVACSENKAERVEPGTSRSRSSLVFAVGLLAGLAVLWSTLFLAIRPDEQNFPLNDDWAFARGAFTLARGNGINYSHWSSMPQVGQWLWAWPFIEIFGESHAALRFSTVVLSLLGVLAFFDLLRQAGLAPGRAAFGAACLALNPLFFELSGTFLTDVPALAFSLIALALYGRAFALTSSNLPRAMDALAFAVIVAVLGAISRQNTITVPFAAGLVLLTHPRLRFHPAWWLAVAVPAAAACAAHAWLKTRPDHYALLSKPDIDLGRLVLLAFTITHYMGLTALPVLAFEANPQSWRNKGVIVLFAIALLLMAGGAVFYFCDGEDSALRDWWNGWAPDGFWALFNDKTVRRDTFPYLTNMLTRWGPFDENEIVMGDRPVLLGAAVRIGLTVLGCVAGAALVVRAVGRLRTGGWKNLLTLFAVLHLPFLLLPYVIFDRYYIVFMPAALYLATNPHVETAAVERRVLPMRRILGMMTLAVVGLFSLGLMHDWLAGNAARWTLGGRALEKGIAASDIEGGFEWNGWHAPVPPFAGRRDPWSDRLLPYTNAMYAHISGRYALSFSVPEGATVIDREPYTTWLPPGRHDFYLVEQHKAESGGP
jgi:Dolichyl-phosphate-mannose-protein mannosyltransferase